MSMIDVQGISKSFGQTLALDRVDIEVQAGTCLLYTSDAADE